MAGHGPAPTIAAVERQLRRGITHMLPTEDAAWVGEELTRRFGLPLWQFTLTATDANRFSLRLARTITGRPKIVVHDHCYHGSVDETIAMLDADGPVVAGPRISRAAGRRRPDDPRRRVQRRRRPRGARSPTATSPPSSFEPALTNVGIVLPEPGYHDAVREITRRTGTLLIIDETHTICAGPGGATAPWGLEPDMLVIGKTIGGGIPVGGLRLHARASPSGSRGSIAVEDSDVGGIGGTLAGYALSLAAIRATLGEVLTAEAFERMIPLAERWEAGRQRRSSARPACPWHVTRLGARAEYHFMPRPPRTGAEQWANADPDLERVPAPLGDEPRRPDDAVPQHGADVARPRPAADVDRHTEVFDEAVEALFA